MTPFIFTVMQALVFGDVTAEETPLHAELVGAEVIRERHAVRSFYAAFGLGNRLANVVAFGAEPAIIGPLDGFEHRLAAQSVETIFVAVIHHVPVTISRTFDQGCVAARPPFFCG